MNTIVEKLTILSFAALVLTYISCSPIKPKFSDQKSETESNNTIPSPEKGDTLSRDQIAQSNGVKLYTKYCASCHNPIHESTKRNVTKVRLTTAIQDIEVMKSLSILSNTEISDIVSALNDQKRDDAQIAAVSFFDYSDTPRRVDQRKLTKNELWLSILSLTSVYANMRNIPGDTIYRSLPSDADILKMPDSAYFLTLMETMYDVAKSSNPNVVPCVSSCTRGEIENFLKSAYKISPSSEDVTNTLNLYSAVTSKSNIQEGKRAVLMQTLLSSKFLYKYQFGKDGDLSAIDLGNKLAYFMTGTMADAELQMAIDNESILNPVVYDTHVDRLAANPKVARQLTDIVKNWLNFKNYDYSSKEGIENYPSTMENSIKGEIYHFVNDLLFVNNGSLSSLFTSNYTYMNEDLGRLYGVQINGQNFRKVSLQGLNRKGILTMPAILSRHSISNGRSPMKRGSFLVENLLCLEFPEAAGDAEMSPNNDPDLTFREYFKKLETIAPCSNCHMSLNSGFAFDEFDPLGREWPMGEVSEQDLVAPLLLQGFERLEFQNAIDASEKLANHPALASCYTNQLVRFAQGRFPTKDEQTLIERITEGVQRGESVIWTLKQVAKSSQFKKAD